VKILSFFFVALSGISCVVPPSCIDRAFGSPANDEHFATLTLFSEPVQEPVERRDSRNIAISERFERGASVRIDATGSMAVSALDMWPERCPTIPREDLTAVSRMWQPLLEQMALPHTDVRVIANPEVGNGNWHSGESLLSLSFGSTSGRSLGLLWDGESTLPEQLDTAVMATLEMVCSNSRLAKRYLLRDLSRQVVSRLECP
jgi:hypothetical protein